jgi:2-haloalkanoic acid dehalogenase type II
VTSAVIFDFYETLVCLTHEIRERVFDDLARSVGASHPPGEAYRHWREHTTRDADLRLAGHDRPPFDGDGISFVTFRDVWTRRSAELFTHWGVEAHGDVGARAYVEAHCAAGLYPEVRDAVESLRRRHRLAVLSDADTDFIERCLERNNLAFDVIVTSEDMQAYKPHVALFREACARLQVQPSEAVYVGDNPWADVAGARNAGMRAVWLNRHAAAWPDDIPPPDTTITSLSELLRALPSL